MTMESRAKWHKIVFVGRADITDTEIGSYLVS